MACGEDAPREQENLLTAAGVEVLRLPTPNGRIDLSALLKVLGQRRICSLLVEGGSRILGAFLEENLADDFHFFYAPKILGDPAAIPMIQGGHRERMSEALAVYDVRARRYGGDVLLSGRFHEHLY
jgi:diaminohydroxyphosphoribosylaminopyrimidine deaminase/5-amino-6-(5-phosphoribosylamino)uracil reductase